MDSGKSVKLYSRSGKPENIVKREQDTASRCREIEKRLPSFLNGYFIFLRANVLPMTRLAYLQDILFFFTYLVEETDLTDAQSPSMVTAEELDRVRAVDVNLFIDYCRQYEKKDGDTVHIYENSNRSLARKKSSVSVMFRQLYRDEIVSKNITDGFNPIRVPKSGEREIKALQDDEVMVMLDAVTTGSGLTEKELQYWRKTKKRDRAMLLLFVTYGLRLSELQQLNVSSFNFSRGEFTIYRKRDKESVMPLNRSVMEAVQDYISNERNSSTDEDGLFLSLQGKRMSQRQIRQLVKKYTSICLHTGRKQGYSPHKLRATTATSLISRGNSIFDVQALLDHEQVTTTQLYARHRADVRRDLVKDIEWTDGKDDI